MHLLHANKHSTRIVREPPPLSSSSSSSPSTKHFHPSIYLPHTQHAHTHYMRMHRKVDRSRTCGTHVARINLNETGIRAGANRALRTSTFASACVCRFVFGAFGAKKNARATRALAWILFNTLMHTSVDHRYAYILYIRVFKCAHVLVWGCTTKPVSLSHKEACLVC